MSKGQIRILIVDDHPLIREGVSTVLRCQPDMDVAGEAPSGSGAIQMFRELVPDITLLDLRLPDMGGVDVLTAIRAEFPDAKIIILTTFEGDVEARRALQAGARGYLLKSMPPNELVEVIRQVNLGKKRIAPEIASSFAEHFSNDALSGREIEVLRLVANGIGNREIGKDLKISEETVKAHVKHIMEKLAANDRTEAVTIAIRRGIMTL